MKNNDNLTQTIMVVEDTVDVRELMALRLEMLGYQVVEAEDGERAVESAFSEHPDLILMDLSLPVMDGFAATQRIRERLELRDIPIIAVTAHDESEYKEKALAAGCNEYFRKPIDFGKLDKLMRSLLPGH